MINVEVTNDISDQFTAVKRWLKEVPMSTLIVEVLARNDDIPLKPNDITRDGCGILIIERTTEGMIMRPLREIRELLTRDGFLCIITTSKAMVWMERRNLSSICIDPYYYLSPLRNKKEKQENIDTSNTDVM